MKKLFVVSLIIAVMVLVGSFSAIAQAQNPAGAAKPSFITLTPGQYVHGWPAFTASYPKDWVEQPPRPGEAIRVADPNSKTIPRVPNFVISVYPNPLPIDNWSKALLPVLSRSGTDFKIMHDKPSQLKDGTPAQEAELEWVRNDGVKINMLVLNTRKYVQWITILVASDKGKIDEDLKNHAYSLTFQANREEPVKVPSDIREFLEKYSSDIVSGNVERIMANFSDQFLNSGMNKALFEQWFRNNPASPVQMGVTSSEPTVTIFEARGDKAYVDGFYTSKTRAAADAVKGPMGFRQVIKENGQWKWYGDQR
jgi:hypothetical protein